MNCILTGDALTMLRTLPSHHVQTCITSPPYYGLRDYGMSGQIGLEETPEAYIARLVEVFREVKRVLRDDGTLWVNIGDSFSSGGMSNPSSKSTLGGGKDRGAANYNIMRSIPNGLKPKDLIGIPWMLAFALRADGWYLRSDIIWHKPNCMPESVEDRPTKSHEYLFLLAKSERYYYDAEAIKEGDQVYIRKGTKAGHKLTHQEGYKGIAGGTLKRDPNEPYGFARDITTCGRNKRSVWTVSQPMYRLRKDLTPEQRSYVIGELLRRGCL